MHANYASNNRKRDNVKIIRIALDLHDVIVDSKKVVLFEYEWPLLFLSEHKARQRSEFCRCLKT